MGNLNIDVTVEHIAKIIYESIYEERWCDVMHGIEGNLFRTAARNVLENIKELNMLNIQEGE